MDESNSQTLIDPLVTILQSGFATEDWFSLFAIVILLICSALASGSEAAFFSLSPAEKDTLKEDESKKAKTAQQLLKMPQDLLATILIVNNFVNVGLVILSSALLKTFFPPEVGNETFLLIMEIFVITLTLLLLGEVIPKIYASKNALKFVMLTSGGLTRIQKTPPVSWLRAFLVQGSNRIHRKAKKKGIKISTDELEQALALTKEDSTSVEEHKILEGIVKLGNTEVCQIMRSRMDVVALENDLKFPEVIHTILESGYSRMPVFQENFDNVIGILFVKDLLPYLNETENESFEWIGLIRKPFFVPENKKIDDLLKEFQGKKVHMAVVVDEYGGSSGICTLEDILEEIVGDITDEFDDDEIHYTKLDDRTYLFEGKTALVDLYKVLDIDGREFESKKGDADSLGGFINENAGRILRNNEYLEVGEYRLIVESSDKRRVKKVKVVCPVQENSETNNE